MCSKIIEIIGTDCKSTITWVEVVTSKAGTLQCLDSENEGIN